MELYKHIAAVNTQEELNGLYADITDRFGTIPDEVASLISLAETRILCHQLGIVKIRERRGQAEIYFSRIADLNFDRVMELIRTSGGSVKPDPHNPQVLLVDTHMIKLHEKSEYLRDRLSSIRG